MLNPLGVPSRMNVGQILETHLGWVAKMLGFYAKTPVFQGANEREIGLLLKMAGVMWAGQALALRTPAPKITDKEIFDAAARHQAGSHAGRRAFRAARRKRRSTISAARTMSQETRDIFHSDSRLPRRRGEGVGGARADGVDNQIAFHTAWIDDEATAGVEAHRVQGGAEAAREAAARWSRRSS